LARGRFLQISVLKSLPKPTPQKNSLQKHKILVLFKGDGPISSDLNAATHSQKNKTNKKTKRKKKPNQKILQKPIHQSGGIQSLNAHLDNTNLKKQSEDD